MFKLQDMSHDIVFGLVFLSISPFELLVAKPENSHGIVLAYNKNYSSVNSSVTGALEKIIDYYLVYRVG